MFALISDEILLSMNLRSNLKIKRIIEFLEKRYGKEIKEYYTQKSDPFNVLISCVLSQRTREENTAKAVKDLFSIASSPEEILKIPDERLQELIKPAGFYRQKSKHIKRICKILLDEHNGRVPKTRGELLKLPGIGYKTADVTLCYGHGIPTVAVDTHVNRISKRLGLVDEKANIEQVRKKLEKLVPENEWYLINLGFVKFGREVCKPMKPECNKCSLKNICEFKPTSNHRLKTI